MEYEEFKKWMKKNMILAVDEFNKQFREEVEKLVKEGRILTGNSYREQSNG